MLTRKGLEADKDKKHTQDETKESWDDWNTWGWWYDGPWTWNTRNWNLDDGQMDCGHRDWDWYYRGWGNGFAIGWMAAKGSPA